VVLCISLWACEQPGLSPNEEGAPQRRQVAQRAATDSTAQISQYIRCIFQDRDGNLWFGTTTDGVVRYDGSSLNYFNAANGFGSDWVNAIQQDAQGDLWFATRDGVVRFDGSRFERYTTANGLASDHVWSLLVDNEGTVWAGTYAGVSRFDPSTPLRTGGRGFNAFHIPPADLSAHPYYQDPALVTSIVQDHAGHIWFATKGGAYRYSPEHFTRFAEPEGLCSDFVNTIHSLQNGRMLFGTVFGGMLYEDRSGALWIGVSATGLCRYAGTDLTCFDAQDGEGIRVVFCMLEDDEGRLWVGTGVGLYRYDPSAARGTGGGSFINVTKKELLRSGA
jgi:ligand-binding sensor domain-containing protein